MLIDIKVVSKSWLSEQSCIWECSYLFENMIAILLDKYLKSDIAGSQGSFIF